MERGRFITFEGGEGAGKSTQIRHLRSTLEQQGISVVTTREPGGSEGAEEIRKLLVTGAPERWDAMTEALLNFAARRDHVEKVIKPALKSGSWVLCDRFTDSTIAYQGVAGGVGRDVIGRLNKDIFSGFGPDMTLVLDLPVKVGLERSLQANSNSGSGEDRFEKMGRQFHETIRKAFQNIAADNPARCVLIDASGREDEVADFVWAAVKDRFGL